MGARNHADGAVGDGRIVHRRPHRRAIKRIADLEVVVVLMPVGGRADAGGLEHRLVLEFVNGITQELRHGLAHLGVERHRGEQRVVERERADLKVLLGLDVGCAVAVGGDVEELARRLELFDAGLQRPHLAVIEEVGDAHEPLGAPVFDLSVG